MKKKIHPIKKLFCIPNAKFLPDSGKNGLFFDGGLNI